MKLGDFSLEVDKSTPGKVIGLFFGYAEAYLKAQPQPVETIDPIEMEASSYNALISSREGNSIDSRGSGIELQTAEPIDMSEYVEAAILPSRFLDDGATSDNLRRLGIKPLPYNVIGRARPSEHTSAIVDICYRYYISEKFFPEGSL